MFKKLLKFGSGVIACWILFTFSGCSRTEEDKAPNKSRRSRSNLDKHKERILRDYHQRRALSRRARKIYKASGPEQKTQPTSPGTTPTNQPALTSATTPATAPANGRDTISPTQSTATSPTQSTATSPTQSTATSPTQSTATSPTQSTATSPTQSTATSPTQSMATSPTQSTATSATSSAQPTASSPSVPTASSPGAPTASSPSATTASSSLGTDALPSPSEYLKGIPSEYKKTMRRMLKNPKCFKTKQEKVLCINIGDSDSLVLAGTAQELFLRCATGLAYSGSRAGLGFKRGTLHDKRYLSRATRSFSYSPGKNLKLTCGKKKQSMATMSDDDSRQLILGAKLEIPPPDRSVYGIYRRKNGEIIYVEKTLYKCSGTGALYRLAMGRPPKLKWQTIVKTAMLKDGGSISILMNKGRMLFIPANMMAWSVKDKKKFTRWVKEAKNRKSDKAKHKPLSEKDLRSAGFATTDKKKPAWFRSGSKGRRENLKKITGNTYRKLGVRKPRFPKKNKEQDPVCKILGY